MTVVDIFVAFFLVVCYEMNFSLVLADLRWDFDQCFFAFIFKYSDNKFENYDGQPWKFLTLSFVSIVY